MLAEPRVTQQMSAVNGQSDLSVFVQTPQKSQMRKALFWIHRWVGAFAGVYILLMSLTGTSLVFHDELAALICPPTKVMMQGDRVPLSQVMDSAEAALSGHKVTGIIAPTEHNRPLDVFLAHSNGTKKVCEVDPYNGEYLGIKKENPVLNFLRDLHFNLLLGKAGRTSNGVGAAMLLTLTLTGLVVWWRGIHNWISGFKLNLKGSIKQTNFSLHSTLGICALPFLLVWSISGFYFGFPDLAEKLLNPFFPVSAQKNLSTGKANTSSSKETHTRPAVDRLIEMAKQASPQTPFVERVALPDSKRPSFRVWLIQPGTTNKSQVFLDTHKEQVLSISSSEEPPAGDQIIRTMMQLHFGTFFGTTTKCLWVLVGLVPASLAVTGLVLFALNLRRRKMSPS